MNLSSVRLLVKDFDVCFSFYADKLNLPITWGKLGGDYASFDVGIATNPMGLSLFKSDLMAKAVGNDNLDLPVNNREKSVLVFKVEDVDVVYNDLKSCNIKFLNEPTDMTGWGMRAVHLRDPEGNLIEFWSELDKSKWDAGLQKEAEEFEL